MSEQPFIVRKYGVPDYRSPEQRAFDEAVAPAAALVYRRMSEAIDLQFSRDQDVSPDAVRCRPADAEPAIASTWQPAYAGPSPNVSVRLQADTTNFERGMRRIRRRVKWVIWRRRLADACSNLFLALITTLDERTRRRRP